MDNFPQETRQLSAKGLPFKKRYSCSIKCNQNGCISLIARPIKRDACKRTIDQRGKSPGGSYTYSPDQQDEASKNVCYFLVSGLYLKVFVIRCKCDERFRTKLRNLIISKSISKTSNQTTQIWATSNDTSI